MRFLPVLAVLLGLTVAATAADDLPAPDALPSVKGLPDPLVMRDGTKVTTAEMWRKQRRPELKRLVQHYMYGYLPPPAKVTAQLLREDRKALGGKATLKELLLHVGPEKAPPVHLLLVVPNARTGPAPVFVGLNFCGNHAVIDDPAVRLPTAWMYDRYPGVVKNKATDAGRGTQKDVWALDQAIDRGYAVATAYSGDIDPDRKEVSGGLRPFIDPDEKAGTIAFWAWGIHRLIDHLVTDADLDAKRIAVVGHSRLGKTALVAGAYDDRVALAIPHQAGCGGTAPSRGTVGESVERINTSFPHWFNANYKQFNKQPDKIPFDQNGVTALMAPRPVLFSNAVKDTWANPDGQFEVLKAAESVWKLLGAGGLASHEKPKIGTLYDGTLGYYIRPGEHSMTRGDWKVYLDFADRHLGKPATKKAATRPTQRLLLIGQGPDGHPPQSHEFVAGLKVLADILRGVPDLEVMQVRADGAWKEGPELIDRSDAVVLYLSEGGVWLAADRARLEAMRRLAKRGGGIVALHWSIGTRPVEPIADCVDLFGGCHGGPDRKYKVLETTARPARHPIAAGLGTFTVKDEFYYRLKFAKADGAIEPVLKVRIDGADHPVAWAYRRPGGGRAFGFSGLHFHAGWRLPEYRRLVAQGVLWALDRPVPPGGLSVPVAASLLRDVPEAAATRK
ncbi:MAG: ThuA domain-containing protein [Gemmataceae bacterium]